jgi:phosphorylase/glycogen(starch) synthase
MSEERRLLFEVSWEVCNKVGGIHTVLRSKLGETIARFGEDYVLVGPLFEDNPEFEEEDIPEFRNLRYELKRQGITTRVGRWKVPERPKVVLVRFQGVLDQSQLLFQLWEDFGVDSMTGGWDYVEPVLFSTVAAKAIEAAVSGLENVRVNAIFHEWMSGAGLLYLKKHVPQAGLVFLTHATMLGRAIASTGADLYGTLVHVDGRKEAARLGVSAKHSMEQIASREADCFATVSEITALEAEHLLGTKPALVLPNGFYSSSLPAWSEDPTQWKESRRKLLSFASRFLKRELSEDRTFLLSSSGRFEYRNKGIDILLDAAAGLSADSRFPKNREVVLFLFYLGGYVERTKQPRPDGGLEHYYGIATHPLWNSAQDPIVQHCREKGLSNAEDARVSVIYVPVYLNGSDGVLNMEYYEALQGCDATVYPSYYEPWGYTPLESIAFSIPTITTDLSGFGRWVRTLGNDGPAARVLDRHGKPDADTVAILVKALLELLGLSPVGFETIRAKCRSLSLRAEWKDFYTYYLRAFDLAAETARRRVSGKKPETQIREIKFTGIDSDRPRLRNFSVKASLPQEIHGLRALSLNLWWSWDMEATDLFSRLDPVLFEKCGYNPVQLLDAVSAEQLESVCKNESFLEEYESVMKRFDAYLRKPRRILEVIEPVTSERPVAYFSMEFGLHESLPVYSGGLGVLAGDHVKSASDLNYPLIGIGLMYKSGYFRQIVTRDGEQREVYPDYDCFSMPVHELRRKGQRVLVSVEFPGRTLYARIWEVRVGRVLVYLLDADVAENSPSDRGITARLYGGGRKTRIEQEMLLGIGGVRLLERELKVYPSVYHMNEGHSAFLIAERLANYVRYDELDLLSAREIVRASTVFTTHTPVMAGNETFDFSLVENYLKPYCENTGLDWNLFAEMGRKSLSDSSAHYEMTVLALRNSCGRNGVSRLHGKVAREMWAELWPGLLSGEVPIGHITNGVHAPTWLTSEMKTLFAKYTGITLNPDLLKPEVWERICEIPDEALWQTHLGLKNRLFAYIRERIPVSWHREGEDPALIDDFLTAINPAPLTIGFARRFALYKRPDLFLQDIERLKKFINNRKHPVQFVIAGKAHPEDKAAHGYIRSIVELSKKKEFLGKIIFLEDYDLRSARRIISGVDLWLNNPRRPNEASGTSGQKAGINGVPNFSVLDGWWDEAWNPETCNGWAIGGRTDYANIETQDLADGDSFYDVLETEILPLYFSRNNQGVPEKWVRVMKNSIISVIREFNTHRMVRDYADRLYRPSAEKYFELFAGNYRKARDLAQWKRDLPARFSGLHVRNVLVEGLVDDNMNVGDEAVITVEVEPGRMSREEILVELVIVPVGGEGETVMPFESVTESEGRLRYLMKYTAGWPGKFSYGVRVSPSLPGLNSCDMRDLGLVRWG